MGSYLTKLVILHLITMLAYISAQHLAKNTVALEISHYLEAPLVFTPSVRMVVLSMLPVYITVQSWDGWVHQKKKKHPTLTRKITVYFLFPTVSLNCFFFQNQDLDQSLFSIFVF